MARSAILRFFAASLSLGAIAAWGSENFFWSAPTDDFSFWQLPILWLVYSLGTGMALSAVLLSGVTGWRALFLGGAIFGFAIEGAVAGTMFQAFPYQLVWTPLAWHALITSLVLFGLSRMTAKWPVRKLVAGWVGLGVFGACFAAFWPLERSNMPGLAPTVFYLVGLGAVVPLASFVLEKVATVELPPSWVHAIAPLLLTAYWLVHVFGTFSPLVLTLPACLWLTWYAMRKLGKGKAPVVFQKSPNPVRHWLFMLAPLITSGTAYFTWNTFGGLPSNIPVAVVTSTIALALFCFLVVKAVQATPLR
jgi:hypothetical protein